MQASNRTIIVERDSRTLTTRVIEALDAGFAPDEARQYRDQARAWAESPDPPDGPDTKSAMTWAGEAEASAQSIVGDAQRAEDARDAAEGWRDDAWTAANQAEQDRIQTGQDRAATGDDRIATGQDRQQTGQDRVQTGQDVLAAEAARDKAQDWAEGAGSPGGTGTKSAKTWAGEAAADAQQAEAARVQTGLDADATASDRIATGQDAVQTAADRTQTGLDRTQTGQDRAETGADRTQTGLDRTATGQDRVQTGLDKTAAETARDVAEGWAEDAETSAGQAEQDRIQTGLDRAATAADRVQTGLDAAATAADRVQTGLDAGATGADALQTAADRVQTGQDANSTATDRVQTGLDANATAADRVQTGLDRVATGEDVIQTGLDRQATGDDRIATGEDAVQTAEDRQQTAADRVQTGLDREATGQDRTAAETARNDSEDARDLAKDWASKPEDQVVDAGEYSAKHYAEKAGKSAADAEQIKEDLLDDITADATSIDFDESAYANWDGANRLLTIGVPRPDPAAPTGGVLWSESQNLAQNHQERARKNIGLTMFDSPAWIAGASTDPGTPSPKQLADTIAAHSSGGGGGWNKVGFVAASGLNVTITGMDFSRETLFLFNCLAAVNSSTTYFRFRPYAGGQTIGSEIALSVSRDWTADTGSDSGLIGFLRLFRDPDTGAVYRESSTIYGTTSSSLKTNTLGVVRNTRLPANASGAFFHFSTQGFEPATIGGGIGERGISIYQRG